MRAAGYTLIELLVVISIMAVLGTLVFTNYQGFSSGQITLKAIGQVQSVLRLAQSNATSYTVCNNQPAISWYVVFNSPGSFDLRCDSSTQTNASSKTYNLENNSQIVSVAGNPSMCGSSPITFNSSNPLTIKYMVGKGIFSFTAANLSQNCPSSSYLTFTLNNNGTSPKSFTITSGGAINAQ